ncbi:hypothetical protein QQ045_018264 [Rhodiola kirilowii]
MNFFTEQKESGDMDCLACFFKQRSTCRKNSKFTNSGSTSYLAVAKIRSERAMCADVEAGRVLHLEIMVKKPLETIRRITESFFSQVYRESSDSFVCVSCL